VDVVLMDVQMPGMNGFEATRRLRDIAAFKDLPVVALTAGASLEHQQLARQAGMNGFIAKPFDVDQAVALIVKLTRHSPVGGPPEGAATPSLTHPTHSATGNLPGIALEKALTHWRDAEHYQKFLRKFVDRYADIVPVLRAATCSDALALSHKFRGAAANLGLVDVAAAAHALEVQLQQNKAHEVALAGLQKALAIAFDSIARYAPALEPLTTQTGSDNSLLAPWLPRLLGAWQSDSSSEVATALKEIGQALPAADFKLLQSALDNYDFRAGEALTHGLLQAPGTSGEVA
jgi:CheY-like chemotaxis protein